MKAFIKSLQLRWTDLAFVLGMIPFAVLLIFGQLFMQYPDPNNVAIPMWAAIICFIAMLGFLVLSGIVVNNGIVLIDLINQLRSNGMTKKEAIVEARKNKITSHTYDCPYYYFRIIHTCFRNWLW